MKVSQVYGTDWRVLTSERFWLWSFHQITFSIWCRGGSDAFVTARIQGEWLLAVPRSQKKFMWQRDHALCTKKLYGSSRMGLPVSWYSKDAQWVPERCPGGKISTTDTTQLLELVCWGINSFFFSSALVLLLKAHCFANLHFPTSKLPQKIIYFCGLLISQGLVVGATACMLCLYSNDELLKVLVLSHLLEITDQQEGPGQQSWACGLAFP